MAEKKKNVCGADSHSINTGNPYASAKHETHSIPVATERAMPLIFVGNISEISTQVTGASVDAYVAMNARTKNVSVKPSKKLKWKQSPTNNNQNDISNAPLTMSFFLPSLSTSCMATTVNTRLTPPISIC